MWPGLSVATHHERIDWHTAGIVLRQEAQLAAVLLGNTDEALAHLGAGAGKVAKCRDGLRVRSTQRHTMSLRPGHEHNQAGHAHEEGEEWSDIRTLATRTIHAARAHRRMQK